MQDKDRKLQQAEGGKEESTEQTKAPLEQATQAEPKVAEDTASEIEGSNEPESKAVPTEDSDDKSPKKEESNDHLDEIDESNAEDAEDTENEKRHTIPMLDYHSMSMENLVGELQRLVKNEKVQAINKHVSAIKYEFDQKFQDFLDEKKEEFISKGGNEVDFRYNSVAKRQFNEVYSDFREKRDQYYKQLDQSLKTNLQKRLEIIEELKGLIDIEEDINTTYNNFKDLQNRWKNAGPIPRANYNDVWRTYHHHMEIFYDFLHLNRELRDLDFKHNLEEKQKLVERAEALADEPDLNKAFRELQTLHKIWKEDIGPLPRNIGKKFGKSSAMPPRPCTNGGKNISKSWRRSTRKTLRKTRNYCGHSQDCRKRGRQPSRNSTANQGGGGVSRILL